MTGRPLFEEMFTGRLEAARMREGFAIFAGYYKSGDAIGTPS
jgi:hypothetical protein